MIKEKVEVKLSHIPNCSGCGEPIEPGESAYAVQSGYVDKTGEFVRTDTESQLFHLGPCLNAEK